MSSSSAAASPSLPSFISLKQKFSDASCIRNRGASFSFGMSRSSLPCSCPTSITSHWNGVQGCRNQRRRYDSNQISSNYEDKISVGLKLSRRTSVNGEDAYTDDTRNEYNDDCFGLISLTGGVVLHDAVFTFTFITLSLFGLLTTRSGYSFGSKLDEVKSDRKRNIPARNDCETEDRALPDPKQIPAIVAALTLVLTPFVRGGTAVLLTNSGENGFGSLNEWVAMTPDQMTSMLEVAVCSVSILYGLSRLLSLNDARNER